MQAKSRVQIWLVENKTVRMEGQIIGFDEYMNIVLDNASEVNVKTGETTKLGRLMLKGENICLIMDTGK